MGTPAVSHCPCMPSCSASTTLQAYAHLHSPRPHTLPLLGVTDDELLRHLMLCMDFYFGVLDTRPWPHGALPHAGPLPVAAAGAGGGVAAVRWQA